MQNIKNKKIGEYEVVFSCPTDYELEQLVKLDGLTYPDPEDRADIDELKMWRKQNDDSFILLKHNNNVIGYIILLPLTKDCYNSYKSGEITEEEITADQIIEWSKNPYVLFNNISIHPQFQNGEAIKILNKALEYKLEQLNQNGIILHNVVAEVDSVHGLKYLERTFNFKAANSKNKRHSLYELPQDKDLLGAMQRSQTKDLQK